MENFSQRLKRLRKLKKLSVRKVAQAVGVSESTYREWEYGRSIQGEPYEKLSSVLGVSLTELMTGKQISSDQLQSHFGKVEAHLASALEALEQLKTEVLN
jgi:transcriptional regulator with XRE-family HTH domain